jgi:guanylate kinase
VIKGRMAKAGDELSHWAEYDYVVVNDDVHKCFGEICSILAVERLKRERQPWISAYVRRLQSEL